MGLWPAKSHENPSPCGVANPGCSRLVCDSRSSPLISACASLGVTDMFNPAPPVARLLGGFFRASGGADTAGSGALSGRADLLIGRTQRVTLVNLPHKGIQPNCDFQARRFAV